MVAACCERRGPNVIYDKVINGQIIDLRSVKVDDADFVFNIRMDNSKNKYIHKVSNDVGLQKKWISNQIQRDGDYYFIALSKQGEPLGLASVYDIDYEKKEAEFGRWVSYGNPYQNVEMVMLLFDLAFNELGIDKLFMRMDLENTKVINFWKTFRCSHTGIVKRVDMELDEWYINKDTYLSNRNNIKRMIKSV